MGTKIETKENFDDLLAELGAFVEKIFHVQESFDLVPDKHHHGVSIEYVEFKELRKEFLNELVGTVTDYVYSKSKQSRLLKRLSKGRTPASAHHSLYSLAKEKFNEDDLKGDFTELLLYNLLQVFFNAVPVVRKSKITTSKNVNRFGLDSIHIAKNEDGYSLYLGEAKTYKSLKKGLKKAVGDVIHKHYDNHLSELDLYLYEDFIDENLEEIIEGYKAGRRKDIKVNLVCIVAFNINKVSGSSREEILESIIQEIRSETENICESKAFKEIPSHLEPRLNYILFPVQNLESLIKEFKKQF